MCIKTNLSRQTGSRNLMGPKTLPTIWHTYMKLVTKYQKCDEKYLGTDGRTDRGKTVYPLRRGYNNNPNKKCTNIGNFHLEYVSALF